MIAVALHIYSEICDCHEHRSALRCFGRSQSLIAPSTLLIVSTCEFQHFVTFIIRKENMMSFCITICE